MIRRLSRANIFKSLAVCAATAVLMSVTAMVAPSARADSWDNGIVKMASNTSNPTAWFVVGGQRYWIPDGGTYTCLQSKGVPGPYYLSDAALNARPDQVGQRARCGADNNPWGYFDWVNSTSPATITVGGWAVDRNIWTRPLEFHAYVGGQAGSGAEGINLGRPMTYRPDVASAFAGYGSNQGVTSTFGTSRRGTQPVCLYAINVGPAGNVLLGCKTVNIKPPISEVSTSFRAYVLNPNNWNSTTDGWNPTTNTWNRGIDVDGSNAQCADIGKLWSRWVGYGVLFTGWDWQGNSKPGWTPIVGYMSQALPGDVVTNVNGGQHVVVVTAGPSSGYVTVLEQNPSSPHEARYATGTSGIIWRLIY